MNDCASMQELISRLLDEDLNAEEQAALAKHLESCPACRTMYEAFTAVSASLSELEEPPERLHENVMAEIRREQIRKKNRPVWRAVLTAAAVLALALGARQIPALRVGGPALNAAVKEIAVESGSGEASPTEESLALEESAPAPEAAEEEADAFDSGAAGAVQRAAAAAPQAKNAPAEAATYAAYDEVNEITGQTEIDLSFLSSAEVLARLHGKPVELRPDLLEDGESIAVLCSDNWIALFEYEGGWYYYDPADPTLRRSALDPGDLLALAEKRENLP